MRIALAVVALLVPMAAHAGGQQQPSVTENSWNGDFTGAWSTNNSGGQGGAGGAGGNATATGGDSSARSRSGAVAGSGATSNNSVSITEHDRLQAPSVGLSVATAYCQNNGGVSGSGPGFSVAGFLGRHDIDCKRFNYAMLLVAMGHRAEAVELLKHNPEVREAFEAIPVVAAPPPPPAPVTMEPISNPDDWKVDPAPRPRPKARHRPVSAPAAASAPGRVTQSAPPVPEPAPVDTAAATAPTGGWADSH